VLAVPRVALTVLAVAAAALPGCAAVQAADQDPPATAAAGVRADTLVGVARRISQQEAAGAVGHAAVRRLARDRALIAAMRGHQPAALRAAAAQPALPASGNATIGGQTYVVRSFREVGFGGEALQVWVLIR
jgi:hypothetical protein